MATKTNAVIPFQIKHPAIFTSYGFVAALTLLLLNDWLLKSFFGNFFTGKLSDFAGLFAFVLFWAAFFPNRLRTIALFTGFLFIWWKSPFSQPFIGWWNDTLPYAIQRTVDYSDLTALLVLPFACRYAQRYPSLKQTPFFHPGLTLIISAFAFAATSYQTEADANITYQFTFPIDTLQTRLAENPDVNYGQGVYFNDTIQDLTLRIAHDFCGDDFEADIRVEETAENGAVLILKRVRHRCPNDEKDPVQLIPVFESLVVFPLGK